MTVSEMVYCEDCGEWFPVGWTGTERVAFEVEDQAHLDGEHDLSGGVEH
jgi:hypothetical protein